MSSSSTEPLPLSDPRTPVKLPGASRPPVLGALTTLRYLIALHVALYHFVRPFERWGSAQAFMAAGYTGVSFFFLLSGFILTYTHAAEYQAGRGSAPRFWMARFARIYPVYLFAVLLAMYVQHHLLLYPMERRAVLANFFLVQSWSSRLVHNFNVPAWSLSCEAFFYLLFPFVALRLVRRSRAAYLWSIAGFVLMAMLAPLWGLLHYSSPAWHELPDTRVGYGEILRIRRLPLLALPEFLAGVSLGWLYVQHGISARLSQWLAWTGGAGLVLVLGISTHLPYVMLHNGLLIPVQCAVILGLSGQHWLTRVLSHPWLMVLGEASYSLYLIHLLVFFWMQDHFHLATSIAHAVWQIALITGFSLLLYLYAERPSRRILLQTFAAGRVRN